MNNNRKIFHLADAIKSVLFILAMIAGLVISFLLFLRPTVSENEKRELAKFPEYSAEALVSGSYFRDIDTWFSDTFPFREQLISAYTSIQSFYGVNTTQIHGTVDEGDDIPEVPKKPANNESSNATSSTAPSWDIPNLKEPEDAAETLGGILLVGDTGYEYYNFNTKLADRYSAAISAAANMMGEANVYDMVVPTSISITLPDNLKNTVKSSDQRKAIDYLYGSMGANVKCVDIYDTLLSHRNQYIYFRTDHHWTQLGAYYAYERFAEAKGVAPFLLGNSELVTYEGFLGSFYAGTNKNAKMEKNPDDVMTIKAYKNATMNVYRKDGSLLYGNYPIIQNVANYNASNKYASAFIAGDNPFTTIVNNDLSDGSSCVVVKESFGNAFVPLLVPHYQNIYVVDYRYYQGSLKQLVADKGVQDVIFVNNISATRSSMLIGNLEQLIAR